jgi:type IV pilus assembly protein PilC
MKFRYSARTKTGELQVGYVEAVNRDTAANILTSHDLFVLTVEGTERHGFISWLFGFINKVRRKDLMVFTRQLSAMMEAKIRVSEALRILYAQTKNPSLKNIIFEISSDVDAGLAFSQALERHGEVFSEFYINLVRSAEVTGRIEESMSFLADYLEKEFVLLSKVRNALLYPAFVVVLFFVVGGILVALVFPQITPIFEEANADVPFVTAFLLGSATFINQYWFALAVVFIALVAGVIQYYRSAEGKALIDQLTLQTPLIGGLFRKLYVTRFAESASVLLKGGIPVAQAIEISSRTVGSAFYRERLHEIAQSVREGTLLSEALQSQEKYFPSFVSQMVAVGEQTGQLEKMFNRVNVFYSREVDSIVSNLVEIIQPALVVVIGLLVCFMFSAILIPIYSLIQHF